MFACATGYYAGRKASAYAKTVELADFDRADADAEKKRLYAPLYADREKGMGWKELNKAISKAMQNYCGGVKREALLKEGYSASITGKGKTSDHYVSGRVLLLRCMCYGLPERGS